MGAPLRVFLQGLLFKSSFFDPVNPPATFFDFVTHDLLVMLGMLVGHAWG